MRVGTRSKEKIRIWTRDQVGNVQLLGVFADVLAYLKLELMRLLGCGGCIILNISSIL
jgi:hypothetical protein